MEVVLIISNNLNQKTISITLIQDQSISIGRNASANIVVQDELCSGRHCELCLTSRGILVRDLKSKNGTFVNDFKITDKIIKIEDVIQIGNHFIKVNLDENEPSVISLLREKNKSNNYNDDITIELESPHNKNCNHEGFELNIRINQQLNSRHSRKNKQKNYSHFCDNFLNLLIFSLPLGIYLYIKNFTLNTTLTLSLSDKRLQITLIVAILSVIIFNYINKRVFKKSIGEKIFK